MIERMRSGPRNTPQSNKETYDSPLGKFEVEVVPELRSEDIGNDDRAFIETESGNRYMVRHSKSRGESLVIYNEREGGFDASGAHPFMLRNEAGVRGPIARIGQPLNVFAITEEKTGKGNEWKSTNVNRIEIRRGIEAAIRETVSQQNNPDAQSLFKGIATAMGRMGDAHSSPEREEVNPLDPKYRR
jgi:hypothetical protein